MIQHSQLMENIFELFLHSTGVTTDSRNPIPGSIFFALKGERFDANAFAAGALEAGCAFAVIDNPNFCLGEQTICVPDTLQCLQELALRYRRTFQIPFLGITGTNGKTTTKELIASVLRQKYRVHATSGNLNNHIGVPLTILSMPKDTDIAIIEMGANHPGEIADLCRIAEPTLGLITGIGKAHLEGFGSVEGIMKTKGELYDWIVQSSGKAFCNTSDPRLVVMAQERFGSAHSCITYGPEEQQVKILAPDSDHPHLSFSLPEGTEVHTQLAGDYNVNNALAAWVVGRYFNLSEEACIRGIQTYFPGNHRSQLTKTAQNTLLVDAYNANPTSMQAALNSFATWTDPHKMVILGDMFELGQESVNEHRQMIDLVMSKSFEVILLIGSEFEKSLQSISTPPCPNLIHFGERDKAMEYLKQHPPVGKTILIKGSRGMKLETLIELL